MVEEKTKNILFYYLGAINLYHNKRKHNAFTIVK